MTEEFALHPGQLGLADLRRVAAGSIERLAIDQEAWAAVDAARALIEQIVAEGRRVYGVNTGFGPLSSVAIPPADVAEMQRRMIVSHCVGVGPALPDAVVRQVILLKLNTLLQGRSGVGRDLIRALHGLFNAGALPVIPSKGSVGASGDLAPLAHLAAAIIGVGSVQLDGQELPATEALERAGIRLVTLGPKEGLAMVNGTQVSLALALQGLFAIENVFAAAVLAGALSTDAAMASDGPFDPRIHASRGQRGQERLARVYASLLAGSEIRDSHRDCDRVQDPYSLRCQPQVMGASLDLLVFAASILANEINAVTDNPLVFAEDDEILYGGNFHGQPIAMAADIIALAAAEVGSMSERRIALLVDTGFSRLPPFLAVDPGLDSGFMVAQVAAASLASENKSIAHPASIDSIPTAANQEDIVSMATYAARRLTEMADNAAAIVAIELLAAAQGIEFRRPRRTSPVLEEVLAEIRAVVPPSTGDRYMKPDIDAIKALVESGRLTRFVPSDVLLSFSESPVSPR